MVTHVVIFSWIAGVTREQVERFARALDQLALELNEIAVITHGADLHFRDGNGDYALVANLADRAAWDRYQAHPKHKSFVTNMVAPIQASRLTIQF